MKKVFKPKCPEVLKLSEYKGQFCNEFWNSFPEFKSHTGSSAIKGKELRLLANTFGISDKNRLDRVIKRIYNGADIGCVAPFRNPTFSTNASSAYEFGEAVSDAIACWLKKGFAYGPVDKKNLPKEAKVSGIMVREKPDGSVRIILNLSAPKGSSVNDGIDADLFPAKMSSTSAWLEVLNKAGQNCWICKTDWSDAYKHVAVRSEDTDLQWFEWGGKFFKELCLIFGSASSAGIYDDAAKTVLDLVCRKAEFPKTMVCQHLDDACAASSHQSNTIFAFDKAFQDVANYLGVKLAPRDNPEKSFAPCKSGIVFGVHYNTEEWTWCIPQHKLIVIISDIKKAITCCSIAQKEVKSLVGKLINIKPLIPTGKFNCDKIMKLLADSNKSEHLTVSADCKKQLTFWLDMIQTCHNKLAIPNPLQTMPSWSLSAFCDAAGGSLSPIGRGSGGICGSNWYYLPWSKSINCGHHKVDGKKVGRKLSALELIGPLIIVSALANQFRRQPLLVWIDNAGSCGIWKKGYSNACPLSSTIATAISTVCAGIGCRLDIKKVTRCSDTGSTLADLLSKARFKEFRRLAEDRHWPIDTAPATIPKTLTCWLQKPIPDQYLGQNILIELSRSMNILGYTSTCKDKF